MIRPKHAFTDQCGNSDGLSVDRCSYLTNQEIRTRAERATAELNARRVREGKPPNRYSGGAYVASVQRLRALRTVAGKSERIIFVYDDASTDNAEHAVVRLSDVVPEEEVAGLLDDIRMCFDQLIAPDATP